MKIHSQADQMGGVWANGAAVRHSPHEFTIDFMRFDFDDEGKARAGVLVQRVNMSPLFVTQLITALQDNWSKYADKAMPKELLDGVFGTPTDIDVDGAHRAEHGVDAENDEPETESGPESESGDTPND